MYKILKEEKIIPKCVTPKLRGPGRWREMRDSAVESEETII